MRRSDAAAFLTAALLIVVAVCATVLAALGRLSEAGWIAVLATCVPAGAASVSIPGVRARRRRHDEDSP